MSIVRWSPAEARAAIAAPDLDRRLGAAHGVPAVIVDLGDSGDSGDSGDDIAGVITGLPIVAIGLGSNAGAGWDVATDDPAEVVAGIEATPQAAVVSAQVLRGHERRTPAEGLIAESLAYATLQAGGEFAAWLATRGRRVRNDDTTRVRVEDDNGTAVVILDRPRLRNLLDARMRNELVDCLRALVHDPERPIRIEGAGSAFCAGGDPAEFGTVADPVVAHLIRSSANVAPWLLAVAHRTTAMVHGACVGAGVELAAFCHHVVAAPDSRFRLPETRMGLMPGAGGTVSIPARIGRQRTLEWLLSGREIDAHTARDWGLVDTVSSPARSAG